MNAPKKRLPATLPPKSPLGFSTKSSLGLAWVLLVAGLVAWPAPPVEGGGTPATGALTDQLQTMGGGGALASVGDDISSRLTGLNRPYFYYIEVPPGTSDLQVDIFDADVLAGANDITRDRDQNRDLAGTVNTKVRYRLYDPDGNLVAARFNLGHDTTPPSSDNAWLNLYNSDTAGITGGDTFADNFGTAAYSNDDGTQNFTGNWLEADDDGDTTPVDLTDDPTTGDVRITGGALRLANQSDATGNFTNRPSVQREVDLSTYAAAVVTFDYSTGTGVDLISNGNDSGDSFSFDVSSNGGTTWVTLDEFGNLSGAQTGLAAYDISNYLASNTRVRLRITNRYAGTNETVDIDNFQIRAVTTANGASPDAGHWQLEVDMSGTVNGEIAGIRNRRQDDVNAFGLRAHDGTPGSGGTELNLYAHSYVIVGVNNNDRSRAYDFFPYITQGCEGDVHDFDFDANQPNPSAPNTNVQPFGSVDLTSRSGTFTQDEGGTMSDNDAWNSLTFIGFNSDDQADDYGIWSMDISIADWDQNNYGPIYVTNEDAAAAPPTASPEAESFRIYFPNDAGNAPAKPYVSHYLNYVDDQSAGPNPPGVGQTSRYAVSIVVANPTGSIGDITFSNTNVVTGHIPTGTETVYGGIAFTTTGTVVSQPTVGATTGDVTWNPGTLSPGDTESIVYYIDITPAAAGDIAVTGASGSGNGTRATFLDETGDATFVFGELCLLVMSASSATPVLVSDFGSEIIDGNVVVYWRTASEAQTVGLDLYRLDADGERVRVNDETMLPLLSRPQGGDYRFVDHGAPLDGESIYLLEEIESNGHRKAHGPFHVTPRVAEIGSVLPEGLERNHHPTPHAQQERLAAARDAAASLATRPTASEGRNLFRGFNNRLRVGVEQSGIYRITAQELADAFGMELRMASAMLTRHRVRLSLEGEEIPWRKVGRGEALEFYGEAIDSPFTGTQVYQLELTRGTVIPEPNPGAIAPDWSGDHYLHTERFEESESPIVLMDIDPESDHWFWGFVSPQAKIRDFSAQISQPLDGATADLSLDLQGAAQGEHDVVIRWNGHELGQVTILGTEADSVELSLDPGELSAGENVLQVELLGQGLVFVDGFDLTYERRLRPENDRLKVTGLDADQLSASPFTSPNLRAMDLTDPSHPRLVPVRALQEGGDYRAIWQGRSGGPFMIASDTGLLSPTLEFDSPSDLRSTDWRIDYLVITSTDMLDAAQELADYRTGQGLNSLVVDVQDVYDEFAFGRRDVRAVRDFLQYAHSSWRRGPQFVVIAGAGTYDHHDYYGLGGNRIPVLLANNGQSLYGSDSTLADFDGDGIPEISIGRIPALVAEELSAYVAKIQTYESAPAANWQSNVLILSDEPDGDDQFTEAGSALGSLLPRGFTATQVDLETMDLASARQATFDELAIGASWLHYTGHGGVDRMSRLGLLTSADVAGLGNGNLPIVSSVTCHINYHGLPGFDALGEHLVLQADGGAAAVFAPTWLARHHQSRLVGDRLFRRVFQDGAGTLGQAVLTALRNAAEAGAPEGVLGTYQLLGDPALKIKALPTADTPDPCEAGCGGPG